jgi:predicted glutamine amidotransferase
MTEGISDGLRLYAVRYASGPEVNTLFVAEDLHSVRMLYPDDERQTHFGDVARVVVSEPLTDLPGMWREVPAGTALIVDERIEEQVFQPISPVAA